MSISTVHSFSQYENKKGFVINQEIFAIQHFIKFWANLQCYLMMFLIRIMNILSAYSLAGLQKRRPSSKVSATPIGQMGLEMG
jgi:hypothetical protein